MTFVGRLSLSKELTLKRTMATSGCIVNFVNVTISSEFQLKVGKFMTGTLSRVRILFERKDARDNPSFANIKYELLTVSLNIFETIKYKDNFTVR